MWSGDVRGRDVPACSQQHPDAVTVTESSRSASSTMTRLTSSAQEHGKPRPCSEIAPVHRSSHGRVPAGREPGRAALPHRPSSGLGSMEKPVGEPRQRLGSSPCRRAIVWRMADLRATRFESPPVRTVRLAYYFRTPEPFLGIHVGSLFDLWREDYPMASETPPRAPIDEAPEDLALIGDSSNWPVPFVTFENPESWKSIFFQNDRFGLLWDFAGGNEDDLRYPGFDTLSAEMDEKFSAFCSALQARGASVPELTSAECYYANEIDGIRIADYVVGFLTNWSPNISASAPELTEGGASFSRHYHLGEEKDRMAWVSVSGDERDSVTMRITARVEDVADRSPAEVLRETHDMLIDSFMQSTSDAMRTMWRPL